MIRTYWDILGRYKWSIVACPVLVLVFVVCETLQPMLMARIVDEGVMHRDIAVVTRIGIWMLGISVAGLLANITNVFVSSNASVGFATELRSRLFRKIQEFSFAEMDKFNSASLITRLTGDVTRLQQVVLLGLRILLRSPMMLVMAFFYVVRIDSGLALIVAGAIPVLGISVYLILRKGFPYFLKMQQKVDAVNAVVRGEPDKHAGGEIVRAREIRVAQVFGKQPGFVRRIGEGVQHHPLTIFPVMQLVLNLSVIVVLWVGGERVAAGRLQVGELVSLVNYLMQILMSLMMLSMIIMNIARASASSDRVLEVLGTEPSLKDSPGASAVVRRGAVEFRNVSFRYGGGETDVLHGISFSVAPGMTVAVAGATGSGKSTLLQLVPRLYDTTGGEVLIDGTDVRDYPLAQLHAQVGMVLQNNVLFSGTIADNLRWGREDASPAEMEAAARAAQAHDFVMSFPDGYDTVLGRGGVNLSGGQKQRLCIARALLRRPKILLLDDSTSAVDTETELKIRRGLREYLGEGTTVFVSTQRVKTMEEADRVLVLDDGKVESYGTPARLKEDSAVYREIFNSQQLTF